MTFLAVSALSMALFVVAPFVAHLLRRRRLDERTFPPASLVPTAQPQTRRRSELEDRLLLVVRASAIVVLALLSATPFVHCSKLTVARRDGASVALAIVLDDSLSMRARMENGTPRFSHALHAARELLSGLSTGDAVAIVLAGSPARVALSSTTNVEAASKALEAIEPSDRATDLDSALRTARGLLEGLPHRDKRVVRIVPS